MGNQISIIVPTEFIQNYLYNDLTNVANFLLMCPSDDGFILDYKANFLNIFSAFMKSKYQQEYEIIGELKFNKTERVITGKVELA